MVLALETSLLVLLLLLLLELMLGRLDLVVLQQSCSGCGGGSRSRWMGRYQTAT